MEREIIFKRHKLFFIVLCRKYSPSHQYCSNGSASGIGALGALTQGMPNQMEVMFCQKSMLPYLILNSQNVMTFMTLRYDIHYTLHTKTSILLDFINVSLC